MSNPFTRRRFLQCVGAAYGMSPLGGLPRVGLFRDESRTDGATHIFHIYPYGIRRRVRPFNVFCPGPSGWITAGLFPECMIPEISPVSDMASWKEAEARTVTLGTMNPERGYDDPALFSMGQTFKDHFSSAVDHSVIAVALAGEEECASAVLTARMCRALGHHLISLIGLPDKGWDIPPERVSNTIDRLERLSHFTVLVTYEQALSLAGPPWDGEVTECVLCDAFVSLLEFFEFIPLSNNQLIPLNYRDLPATLDLGNRGIYAEAWSPIEEGWERAIDELWEKINQTDCEKEIVQYVLFIDLHSLGTIKDVEKIIYAFVVQFKDYPFPIGARYENAWETSGSKGTTLRLLALKNSGNFLSTPA